MGDIPRLIQTACPCLRRQAQSRSLFRAAAALALLLVALAQPQRALAEAAVGTVSLLVGQAYAVSSDGIGRRLERGAALRVGDRIETPAGAHVHVQFVDGARLSVRPMSRLVIEDYSSPQTDKPGAGGIRFRLEAGVVRSITGQWGDAAKDRFRLNTPLAAIGVRGTDFAVRAEPERTSAAVYTGAIVVAALDGACAASLGPCINGSERLLTEAMKGQMVQLSRSQSTPELVPAVDLLAHSARAVPFGVVATASNARPAARSSSAPVDTSVSDALAAATARQAATVPGPVVNLFAWGRNANSLVGDTLSVPTSELLAGGARPTVGIFSYTLFTTAPALSPSAVLGAGQASASLRLASSHAGLVDIYGQPIETVAVTGGTLELDFSRLLFSTSLSLSGERLGQDTIRASGSISRAGLFYSAQPDQLVAGAVSPDGRQAGYLFEKRVDPGLLRGITLWGR